MFFRKNDLYDFSFIYKYFNNTPSLFKELNDSNLLYLPLRFTFPKERKNQMITLFVAKTYDYLQCQVPILVQAPHYFFNYRLLEQKEAAFYIGSLDDKAIQSFLNYISTPLFQSEAQRIVHNANRLANNFKGERVANSFLDQLSYLKLNYFIV